MYITEQDLWDSLEHYMTKKSAFGSFEYNKSFSDFNVSTSELCERVNTQSFYFHKVKMHLIPKHRGGNRVVFTMDIRDYLVQYATLHKFEIQNPTFFSDSVYGFRVGFGPSQMVKHIFGNMKNGHIKYMLRMDAKKFVNFVDINILTCLIDKYVKDEGFSVLLKRYISHNRLRERDKGYFDDMHGIFTGGPFAGFLINLYLIEFDDFVNESDVEYYYRYGDDIFAFSKTREQLVEIYALFSNYLKCKLSLTSHELKDNGKSCIFSLEEDGFFHFYDYSFNESEILMREPTITQIKYDISNLVKREEELQSAINKVNYYFTKSYVVENYKSDCYFICFSICTRLNQFTYLDNEIKKMFIRRFGSKKENRELMKNLISLKKFYYYIKKRQREYQGRYEDSSSSE